MRAQRGTTLPEALVGLVVIALLATFAAGALAPAASGRSVESAARSLATTMRRLRTEALLDGRARALVFAERGNGEPIREVVDGDADGVSRRDVREGVDAVEHRFSLARDHPGVGIGALPASPERGGSSGDACGGAQDRALRFGRARIAAFHPDGGASAGSVELTDGRTTCCRVVVSGAGGRVRLECSRRGG